MDIASAPATPDSPQAPPSFRRSFTLPARQISSPNSISPGKDIDTQSVETLYGHNAGRIVSFSPAVGGTRRHSSVEQGHSGVQDEPVGTLPWASATEDTLAVGPLRIYKLPNNIAFLNSGGDGGVLKPILPTSRCWCVDGESKFVLRVGPNTYYRIELPFGQVEDQAKVEEFKGVLAKLLQYETTTCPFKRGFTVDLPESPQTPVRRRPWRPRERPQPAPTTGRSHGPVRRLGLWERPRTPDRGGTSAEDELGYAAEGSTDSMAEESTENSETSHDSETTDDSDPTPRDAASHAYEATDTYKTPTRPQPWRVSRATTAPPQLSLQTPPNSRTAAKSIDGTNALEETSSLSSSVDSFHSFHSPISPLPSSPVNPNMSGFTEQDEETISVPRVRSHKRDDSELTVTTGTEELWDLTQPSKDRELSEPSSPVLPQTPTLISDTTSQSEEPSPEAITPSSVQLRRRKKVPRHRSDSPLPSPANLCSPSARLSGHHLTTAILQKTCSLLLGPPTSLVALMLNIASRIANGTYRGFSFGYGESGQRIPCSWDFNDTDDEGDQGWEEDDYGFALGHMPSSKMSRSKEAGGSWEID